MRIEYNIFDLNSPHKCWNLGASLTLHDVKRPKSAKLTVKF